MDFPAPMGPVRVPVQREKTDGVLINPVFPQARQGGQFALAQIVQVKIQALSDGLPGSGPHGVSDAAAPIDIGRFCPWHVVIGGIGGPAADIDFIAARGVRPEKQVPALIRVRARGGGGRDGEGHIDIVHAGGIGGGAQQQRFQRGAGGLRRKDRQGRIGGDWVEIL